MACRVFIADDVEALRTLWRIFLTEDPGIEVVGEAADGQAAVDGVRALRPDVMVLDLTMPVLDGLEVLRTLSEEVPETRIVVASGFAAARLESVTLGLGAIEYFEKGNPPTALHAAVRRACDAGPQRASEDSSQSPRPV